MKEFGRYTGEELDNIQCFLTYNEACSQNACIEARSWWEAEANCRRLSTSEVMRFFSRDLGVHWWIRDRLANIYDLDRRCSNSSWFYAEKPFYAEWIRLFWERLESLRRRTHCGGEVYRLANRSHEDVVFIERALKLFIILGSQGFPDLDKWTSEQSQRWILT